MWRRSRPAAFRRNLHQPFDSPSPRPGAGAAFLRLAGASSSSSVCPCPSRALNYYSSKASPFSEILPDSRASSHDPIFIKRMKVQEDVVGVESHDSEPDIALRDLFCEPHDVDPLESLARLALEVCSNQTITWKTRIEAVDMICVIANKPDSLEEYELVNPILQAMLPFLVVGGDSGHFQELASAARTVVEKMALNHPEPVFSSVLEFASLNSQNTNPKYRCAAVCALGLIAEGCSEPMKDKLEPLLGIVLGDHRDAELWLRGAASTALRQFVDHLRPEIVSQSQSVLPCILSGLHDEGSFIKEHSYHSLQALCDSMTGEEILPFLDPIMNKLFTDQQCLHHPLEKERSFSAMCSVAAAADQHFVPYAERVLEVLARNTGPYLEQADATRALGLFAVHTRSAFAPYLGKSMRVMLNISAHYHEDVRLQGVIGLKNILTAAAAVYESRKDDAAMTEHLLGTVMDRYIKAMDEDGDKRVVAQICTNTAGILEDFGYTALETYVPQIIASTLRLLQGQPACQRADDPEHEETLMAAVSNLLSVLPKAAGTSSFAPSVCSMLSDAYIKLLAAPGSSRYRATTAA